MQFANLLHVYQKSFKMVADEKNRCNLFEAVQVAENAL